MADGTITSFLVTATPPTSAEPQIVGIELETAKEVSSVVLRGRLHDTLPRAYNPKEYTVETSLDGVNWNDRASGTGTSWTVQATMTAATTWPIMKFAKAANGTYPEVPANTNPLVSTFTAPVLAKWIRLVITDTYYGEGGYTPAAPPAIGNTQIAELEIY